MKVGGAFHLTYCSNIHPGESWAEVDGNLRRYIPRVRRLLACDGPFGIGLRLSAAAAESLERPADLEALQSFLQQENSYVFTINGFPYGTFHGVRVKEEVYLPDWKDPLRLEYSNRLARLLARLLPQEAELEGSVSTVPGAFRTEVRSRQDESAIADHLIRHVAYLHRLRQDTGKNVGLALEPEPRCQLEVTDDLIGFFQRWLLSSAGVDAVRRETGLSTGGAEEALYRHLGVCYDACHMAVEFEEPLSVLRRLQEAGIRVLKFQISAGLRVSFRSGDGTPARLLGPFAEGVYLHQVVERSAHGLVRFTDLPEALQTQVNPARPGEQLEWRVHFHVPIFLDDLGDFRTTQDHIVTLLAELKKTPDCPYLEVETYTWDVLPDSLRTTDTATAVARELGWVRDQLEQR